MPTTDEIRELLEKAKELEAPRQDGMDPIATHLRNQRHRQAEGLRQEALTLAIYELLDTELVLADPAEVVELAVAGKCRECGCTELNACTLDHGRVTCAWAEPDLCTACVPDASPNWIHPPRIVAAPGG